MDLFCKQIRQSVGNPYFQEMSLMVLNNGFSPLYPLPLSPSTIVGPACVCRGCCAPPAAKVGDPSRRREEGRRERDNLIFYMFLYESNHITVKYDL